MLESYYFTALASTCSTFTILWEILRILRELYLVYYCIHSVSATSYKSGSARHDLSKKYSFYSRKYYKIVRSIEAVKISWNQRKIFTGSIDRT